MANFVIQHVRLFDGELLEYAGPPGYRGSFTISIQLVRPVFDCPFRPLGRCHDLYNGYHVSESSRFEVRGMGLFDGETVAYVGPFSFRLFYTMAPPLAGALIHCSQKSWKSPKHSYPRMLCRMLHSN